MTRFINESDYFKTNIDNYTIVKHRWLDIIRYVRLKDVIVGASEAMKYKGSFIFRLKLFYYYLDSGYVRKCLKSINPDIVHIHGLAESSSAYIRVCNSVGVKYIVSLHGLIGISDCINTNQYNKEYEASFLWKVKLNQYRYQL
jgi:hypothetical protein